MPMRPEDRTEGPELEPPRIQLLIRRIVRRPFERLKVPSNVGRPVGIARERKVQPSRNLSLQIHVRAVNIARPCRRAVSLLPQKR